MRAIKNSWFKNTLISVLNLSILGFLFFVGSVIIYEPNNLRGQTGIVIPGDALIYQGRLSGLTVTKDVDKITVESQGQLTLYPVVNDQEVLTGSQIELKVPVLNFQTQIQEISQGIYNLNLSKKLVITSQVPDFSLSQMTQWLIQPLEYSFSIRGDNKGQSLNVFPVRVSTLEKSLDTSIQTVLYQSPVVGYKANANIASCSTVAQEYNIPFSLSFRAKILDADGNPLINKTLSATLELPEHNYSETISVTTDNNGIFSYSRTESAIIKLSGGNLVTLTQPLSIEGTSFVIAQQWWAPEPPSEGQPDYGNQDEAGVIADNEVGKDPVNVATGNAYVIEQDLFIPGKGLPIKFIRAYNTQMDYQGPLGFGWTHSYNIYLTEQLSGNVVERDEDGTILTFTKNPDGSYDSPAGNHDTLTKNFDGTYQLRKKHGIVYNFNSSGKLTSITDTNGNQTTLTYTGAYLTSITDASGRQAILAYDPNGRIISLTDPLARVTTYSYDSSNNFASVTDALGMITTYEYNEHHCIKTVTDPQRETYEGDPVQSHRYFSYDPEGRCKEFMYDGNKYKITLEYESGRTKVTNSRGYLTTHYYTEIGGIRIVNKIVDAAGGTVQYTWDADLNKTSSADQNGNTTNMTYDANGNMTTITDPLGNLTTFNFKLTYNKVTSITDPLGNATNYEYNANGNLVRVIDTLGGVTTYTYDTFGNMTSTTNTNGNATGYEYDSYGNLVTTTDALGNQTHFTYDLVSNSTQITNAKGNSTFFTYDALNRLIEVTYSDGTKLLYAYDQVGNRISVTNPREDITNYGYDETNTLTKAVDALRGITTYSYDTEGNRGRVTDANRNQTTYNYDKLNRLVKVLNPLAHQTQYSYDPAGNRINATDANGNNINYEYDAANRLIRIVYPDASTVVSTYDATGKRTSMADSQGTTTYTYDELNRIVALDGPESNGAVTYTYDSVGNRLSFTNQDGAVTYYNYDALNRLISLTNPQGEVTTYSYDEASNLTQMVYPNSTSTEYVFDNLNRLLSLTNKKDAQIISSYSYRYDAAGMRTKVILANGDYVNYTYDALNRLTDEVYSTGETINYGYDSAGNRLTKESPQQREVYYYDKDNRLLGIKIYKTVGDLPGWQQGSKIGWEQGDQPTGFYRGQKTGWEDNFPPGFYKGVKKGWNKGEILVKFKSGTQEATINEINAKYGAQIVKIIPRINVYKLKIPTNTTAENMVKSYKQEAAVEYAELNYKAYALAIPNDPEFLQQWGLNNTGQTGGTPDADIDAPEAWYIETGDVSTVIAIIDTGCDLDHPDLAGKFIAGYDFVNGDDIAQDDHGHGTYVAGIAAAKTNNAIGGAGIMWQNQIIPVKVLDSGGSGDFDAVASGIIYAVDNGADVLSLSLGGSAYSETLEDAMRYAYERGAVVVCAVGNDNGPVLYPAAFDPYAIAVAATDHNDIRAPFSNYGPEVDVAAPGVNIRSNWWDNSYRTASGTSASTPFVSGLAGLMLSQNPNLTNNQVTAMIKASADDVNSSLYPGEDNYLGAGRINAYLALTAAIPPEIETPDVTIAFTYDNNGNLIKKSITSSPTQDTIYEYDYENRLVKITYPDATTSEYVYDGAGKRITSSEEGEVTKYLYDGLNVVIEKDILGNTQASYTRGLSYGGGIGGIISATRAAATSYYHYDGIGAVTELTNSTGQVIQFYAYDAFGNILSTSGNITNPYQFSTKEYNSKSGLTYFGARYYDPKIGRFITPDPLTWGPDDKRLFTPPDSNFVISLPKENIIVRKGVIDPDIFISLNPIKQSLKQAILQIGSTNPQNYHRYIYCFNNPVNLVDIEGNHPVWIVATAASLLVTYTIELIAYSFGYYPPSGLRGGATATDFMYKIEQYRRTGKTPIFRIPWSGWPIKK